MSPVRLLKLSLVALLLAGCSEIATVSHTTPHFPAVASEAPELVAAEQDYPFAVQNFISLVGEAMGMTRQDLYKRMVLYRDIERVLAEAAPYITANSVDADLVQLALPKELWGAA